MIPHLPHHEVWTGVEGVERVEMNFHTPTPLLGVGGVVWRGKSGEVRCGNGRGHAVSSPGWGNHSRRGGIVKFKQLGYRDRSGLFFP
jgi:hypothetical protein